MNRRVKLKEVCREVTVGHVGPMADEYVDDGIPFLRSQNILPFRLDDSNLKFISETFHKKLKKSALSPGDVVVVRTGYPGTACVIPRRIPVANCADLVVIRPSEEIDCHFLCCLFNSAWGRGTVAGSLVGVAQQHFNIGVAKEMEVMLPPIGTQRRIGSILSAYDDLIENNTRRIKVLEEMARMLYREWFVYFRSPGHEKARMVASELGPIPQGWSVQPVEALTSLVTKGTTPTTLGRLFQESGVNFIKVESISESGAILINKLAKIDTETHEMLKRSQLRQNDILFSIAGAIGRVALVPIRVLPANTNQALAILRCSDPILVTYLLSTVRSANFQNFSLGRVVQTAQANVSLSILKSAPVLLPPPTLLMKFREAVEPILALVEVLSSKIENLRATRDLLLPKLISGEIPVEAADDAAERAEQIA